MDTTFYAQYIPRRMQEIGQGDKYYLKIRHLVLFPGEVRTVPAYNEYFYLLEAPKDFIVESDFGLFDVTAKTNELQYEHQGKIRITNRSPGSYAHIKFIQVIPKR